MIGRHRHGFIGIDLGTRSVKLAQARRIGAHMRLTRALIDRADGDSSLDRLATEIRAALDAQPEFHGRTAAVTLSIDKTDMRGLRLPDASHDERYAMVAGELASVHANESAPREFALWTTETETEVEAGSFQPDNVGVLSAAASLVQEVATCLSDAGLNCEVLDGLPQALARAAGVTPLATSDSGPLGLFDWGSANATLVVVCDGTPVFTRHLRDCGIEPLVDAVSQTLGLTRLEARQILVSHGLPHPTTRDESSLELQEAIAELVAGHLQHVLEQLTKTIAYLRVQRPRLLPSRYVLFGGGAAIRNVAPLLASKTQVPFEPWTAPDIQSVDDSEVLPMAMFGPATALSTLAWEL